MNQFSTATEISITTPLKQMSQQNLSFYYRFKRRVALQKSIFGHFAAACRRLSSPISLWIIQVIWILAAPRGLIKNKQKMQNCGLYGYARRV